jgi:hypothetical protein
MNKYEIIIVGGGASALMLSSLLPKKNVLILETNRQMGAKMLISGGGKCNITNQKMGSSYFVGDAAFIQHSLKRFNERALLKWLEVHHLVPQLRKETQYFCEHSAKELVDILTKEARKQTISCNEKVLEVSKNADMFTVKTDKRELYAEKVVVASGGLSFPKIGASDIGYRIATSFGHSIVKTAPGLVGFTVQKEQFFFKELSGLSTEVKITVNDKSFEGALLFTHKGMSGPAILNASLYWEKGKMTIDFLPNFSLKSMMQSKKQLSSLLPLPKRLTKAFLVQLNLQDKNGTQLTKDELNQLETLHHYEFSPAGTFGYGKAEVTKGGVCTKEINAKTMMSQNVESLYFLGEVLDVTGELGGYNFQWAFSSAYSCAQSLK